MNIRYILIGKEVIPEPHLIKWAKWFETAPRHVKKDVIGGVIVSTVFLALDHDFSDNKNDPNYQPLIFETMIFGDENFAGYQTRCRTWEEAEKMHEKALKMVGRCSNDQR